jgi:hypothetical protein
VLKLPLLDDRSGDSRPVSRCRGRRTTAHSRRAALTFAAAAGKPFDHLARDESGLGKIDPAAAMFDAAELMATHPAGSPEYLFFLSG